MLNHQTHSKPKETLEFKLTKPRKTFSVKPSILLALDSNWMIGLTNSEVYISVFDLTEEDIYFELYTDIFDEFSFGDLTAESEQILSF